MYVQSREAWAKSRIPAIGPGTWRSSRRKITCATQPWSPRAGFSPPRPVSKGRYLKKTIFFPGLLKFTLWLKRNRGVKKIALWDLQKTDEKSNSLSTAISHLKFPSTRVLLFHKRILPINIPGRFLWCSTSFSFFWRREKTVRSWGGKFYPLMESIQSGD